MIQPHSPRVVPSLLPTSPSALSSLMGLEFMNPLSMSV
eukprot:CAMPEP_0172504498 /NCGR_PEP_ID=MMETSP1066-20121228/179205_1 /TAXON_ID=671091 /ORGANISM="Coscinodiscus wailesii, Strain CCMP2513" /LENGTH=37 /DNA_ID= /DNA_START= /DNA_END= /DNA_ORIENTATION=